MTQLHSITFETIKFTGSRAEGTKEYHVLYLTPSTTTPGLFEIKKHNPFLKEKTTSISFDFHTRIVGYSTNVPIVVMCDGHNSMILMPNHIGQLVFLPPDGYLPDSQLPVANELRAECMEIIGILPNRLMHFLIFPEMLE
jgi:hypothetical protein